MFEERIDLTKWVMHFVHDRNVKNEPVFNRGRYSKIIHPCHEERIKNMRYDTWEIYEEERAFDADAVAFDVLMRIVEGGHVRSGWSFRNGKPTIYGPNSACCFTEMPLYALIEYSRKRKSNEVGLYAIGLLRNEFYQAGGRPVIYGLSSGHKEVNSSIIPELCWPRKLDPSCGISEVEQYRYVAMSLSDGCFVDWEHEREWRWSDAAGGCSCPGLPIWLAGEPIQFSQIIIIVQTQEESHVVLNKIKELYDAGSHNYGHEYSRESLLATKVVALDDVFLRANDVDLFTIKLDNIPSQSLKELKICGVDYEFVHYVRKALDQAHYAAKCCAEQYVERYKSADGYVKGFCGSADLCLLTVQSELASALHILGESRVIGGCGFFISNFGKHAQGEQALSVHVAAVRAAKEVMEHCFPGISFSVEEIPD